MIEPYDCSHYEAVKSISPVHFEEDEIAFVATVDDRIVAYAGCLPDGQVVTVMLTVHCSEDLEYELVQRLLIDAGSLSIDRDLCDRKIASRDPRWLRKHGFRLRGGMYVKRFARNGQ